LSVFNNEACGGVKRRRMVERNGVMTR